MKEIYNKSTKLDKEMGEMELNINNLNTLIKKKKQIDKRQQILYGLGQYETIKTKAVKFCWNFTYKKTF